MKSIAEIRVEGFRSLRDVTLSPGRITVLIGPNGAGKSNFLSFLKMIPLIRTHSLGRFVGLNGGAAALLHYGPKVTSAITFGIEFAQDGTTNRYAARLEFAAGDRFVFTDETVSFRGAGWSVPKTRTFGTGHFESQLRDVARDPNEKTAATVNWWLSRMSFFHVHDTSQQSVLRGTARTSDDRYLRSDGSNLAAVLNRLSKSGHPDDRVAWDRITVLVRRIAPYVKTLEPELLNPESPESSSVRLRWTDQRDYRFDVADLSDGTLRALALFTALAQPADSLPAFLCIDEPELGLHPAAINLLVELIRSVSDRCQVMLATQSPALLDHFAPEEVVVVEQHNGETSLRRLDPEALKDWLDDYKLSELYDKNVLGGRP